MVFIEFMIPPTRFVLASKVLDLGERIYEAEVLKEKRKVQKINQRRNRKDSNKQIRPRTLYVGDLGLFDKLKT